LRVESLKLGGLRPRGELNYEEKEEKGKMKKGGGAVVSVWLEEENSGKTARIRK